LTNEEIRELIQMVVDSGIAEMEVQRGDDRVCIRRVVASRNDVPHLPEPARTIEAGAQVVAGGHGSGTAHNSAAEAPDAVLVKSPIVGTFYDAPSPGAPPFVRVGDQVEPGQVLCIIESMKLMNEIEAEMTGTVVSKLMETGRPVEYGEALFAVRPR